MSWDTWVVVCVLCIWAFAMHQDHHTHQEQNAVCKRMHNTPPPCPAAPVDLLGA